MRGFDPKFVDLPDYILKITKEIWEDRGVATLNDYYGDDRNIVKASEYSNYLPQSFWSILQQWRHYKGE